ncbi:3-mercaptopyruvate sulfurtransferase-like [Corythoichthys intestinalis]|uniref:3-mercaptopyruvate sulfurtransferase-like n=1 Tax=Corythoichthys intestinalis TaxID=161448 RepID=UPI0025A55B4C|nr:3-mercaptopyruvate sulfurtransferase-like [Corythoichthys intestinalis]XP_061792420.1 3-mercaptopyruvate sulfurtransferase-like [Nerophis lumbriciformis]
MSVQASALVTSRWLAEAARLHPPKIRILDASWYLPKVRRNAKNDFRARHIPGATFFDLNECCDRSSPLEHMLPSSRTFADYAGRLGVDADTHVVVYDASDFGIFSAPRAWWMFRVFGHGRVSVLDGGLRGWQREGRPVSDQPPVRRDTSEFKASLNRSWVKSYQDIVDNLDSKNFQLVDARPTGRFRGLDPEPRDNTEPGHIPGSISLPFHSFLSPSGHFLPKEHLWALFSDAGVDLSRPLCASCGSAVTACHVALAAHQCGHPGVSVYDGGWSEWYARAAPQDVISEGRGKHL